MKRDGNGMPLLGFGTYGRTGEDGIAAMISALEAGYRLLDTAQSYGTEREVGEAIHRSGLDRDAVFVTTKIDTSNLDAGRLIPSLEQSLSELGMDRVDLTLIHWPAPHGRIGPEVYLPQLAEAQAAGLTRLIGVSNFTIDLLTRAEDLLGAGALATNQVELNPHFRNRKLADFCTARGLTVTCYQPIAKGRLSADPVIAGIAAEHGATAEQVALAWEMANGYACIPTSSRPDRIRSNFGALDLQLGPEDMAALDGLDRGHRAIDPDWGPHWD